jgi:hypothetical protein
MCTVDKTLSDGNFTVDRNMLVKLLFRPWVSNLFTAKGHTCYCRLGHEPQTKNSIPNHLDCVIFIVHTQFTNMATGCRLETHDLDHDVLAGKSPCPAIRIRKWEQTPMIKTYVSKILYFIFCIINKGNHI